MERRGENLAVVTMLAASGVVWMWLMSISPVGASDFDLPLAMLGAGAGAALVGVLVARWFGQPGLVGWLQAALAALVATGLGAAMGAGVFHALEVAFIPDTFGMAPQSIPDAGMIGGWLVISSLGSPAVGVPWLVMMTGIHLIARGLRG